MTDIVKTEPTVVTTYCVGVKHLGKEPIQFIANYQDHLTALKYVNKLNCTRGIATGDVYVMEALEHVETNGL